MSEIGDVILKDIVQQQTKMDKTLLRIQIILEAFACQELSDGMLDETYKRLHTEKPDAVGKK